MLLLVTMAAFEVMSVGTALPTMVAELHGQRLYSWPFTASLAASVIGTVLAGRLSDTRGPRVPLLAGPAVFGVGLLVAGAAPTMEVLLAGRLLQGLGAGMEIVVIYVLIALVYPERVRPAAFGAVSAAWVLPALVGPAAAGLVTEHLGWRWIFFGLAPFVLLGLVLLAPLVRQLPAAAEGQLSGRRGLVAAALAAAVGLSALTWAAQHPASAVPLALAGHGGVAELPRGVAAGVLAAAGLALLVPALRRLLPPGTVTARRGLPSVVLVRGLLAGSFFGVEAYLPLTLTAVHGASPLLSGLPLTVGALGWSAASNLQGRFPDVPSERLIRTGLLLLAAALAATTAAALQATPYWLVLVVWPVAGAGMGLAMPAVGVRLLQLSPPGDRGFNSAALQIWDMLLSAACSGLGGVLLIAVASAAAPAPAVLVLDPLLAGLALAGAAIAGRTAAPARPATLERP
jgi:MFS family permease